jgi:hypothetical protein
MKISDYLQKKQWTRRTKGNGIGYTSSMLNGPLMTQMKKPSGNYEVISQDKFLNEISSKAHIIYDCNHRSMRPKFKYDTKAQKNVLDGYEDVCRMSVSWQEAIRGNKAATCGGNPVWVGNESGEEGADAVNEVKAHINVLNLQAALLAHFYAMFGTGDGALYFYEEEGVIKWQCFSFEDGDNCNETADREDSSKKMGVRLFDFEGYDAVEFYRSEVIELYVRFPDDETLATYFPDTAIEKTDDGYYFVKSVRHGLDESPFCYHREKDIPSGPVQNNIEDFENLLSDCGENIKYYAYQILFLSGGAISLPNANFGGKVIGSKTSDGDAKILEPADASNTLDIGFKKTYNAICDGSKSVFIKPEELKGQNDSGAYIANLYWPELQWATLFYARYHSCMVKILSVIKKLVGYINQDIIKYSQLKMSYMFEPYIPKNKLEQSTILQQGVQAGFISIETATEESDVTNPLEMKRLAKQQAEADQRLLLQQEAASARVEGEGE